MMIKDDGARTETSTTKQEGLIPHSARSRSQRNAAVQRQTIADKDRRPFLQEKNDQNKIIVC